MKKPNQNNHEASFDLAKRETLMAEVTLLLSESITFWLYEMALEKDVDIDSFNNLLQQLFNESNYSEFLLQVACLATKFQYELPQLFYEFLNCNMEKFQQVLASAILEAGQKVVLINTMTLCEKVKKYF